MGTYYPFICEPLLGARSYSRHKGAAEYDGNACSGRPDFLVEGADSGKLNQPGVFISFLVGFCGLQSTEFVNMQPSLLGKIQG